MTVGRRERGAAPVEFVLVSLIFIPLVMGIFQFGLYLHAHNTMVACAHEGARTAAAIQPGDRFANGALRTQECITTALHTRFAANISPGQEGELVVMRASADMPALGFFGPGLAEIDVAGHAVLEPGA